MRKCVLPLLLCAVLLCGCGGEKSLTVQDQYRTVVSADMEAEVVSRTASDDRTVTSCCRQGMPRISARPTVCQSCCEHWRRAI